MNSGSLMTNQIEKMKSFIQFEAHNKCEEILAKACQDKEAKKLEMIHKEKEKIETEFEKKVKSVSTNNKIQMSKDLSTQRMSILTKADELMTNIKKETLAKMATIVDSDMYDDLLEKLIFEGLVRINETDVKIVCREVDFEKCQRLADKAAAEFAHTVQSVKDETGTKCLHEHMQDVFEHGCKVTVQKAPMHLPDSCCGGVALANAAGNISCMNTLRARLDICFEEQMPQVRDMLYHGVVLGDLQL